MSPRRVIGIYMEGLPNPREFFEVAREVHAVKPIVLLKSGKSDMGTAAALSHTGAVAGSMQSMTERSGRRASFAPGIVLGILRHC